MVVLHRWPDHPTTLLPKPLPICSFASRPQPRHQTRDLLVRRRSPSHRPGGSMHVPRYDRRALADAHLLVRGEVGRQREAARSNGGGGGRVFPAQKSEHVRVHCGEGFWGERMRVHPWRCRQALFKALKLVEAEGVGGVGGRGRAGGGRGRAR